MTVDDARCDAFLRDRLRLWQPLSGGLRAGHDALLVAACVGRDADGRALDMGAGTGAVGLVAAWRAAKLEVVLAERDAACVRLLCRSISDAAVDLARRASVVEIDLLAKRPEREAAGLFDASFDCVLTNPPFHPAAGRRSPDPMRAAALTMPDTTFLLRWLAVAAALLRQDGRLVMIARPDNLSSLLDGVANRFGSVAITPIHTAERPAHRILISAVRGSRAPLRILPSFDLDETARRQLSEGADMPALLRM